MVSAEDLPAGLEVSLWAAASKLSASRAATIDVLRSIPVLSLGSERRTEPRHKLAGISLHAPPTPLIRHHPQILRAPFGRAKDDDFRRGCALEGERATTALEC